MKLVARILVLVPLILAAPGARAAEDVGALVDKVIQAYGGKAALARTQAQRQVGRTVSMMRGGMPAAIVRTYQPPLKLRVEILYPQETPEVRLLDAAKSWKHATETTGSFHDAMVLQAARLSLPLALLDAKSRLRDAGLGRGTQGEPLRVIEWPVAPNLILQAEIDPRSGRIARSRGVILGQPQKIEFVTDYSNFATWNGILVAMREDQYAMGHYTGYTEIDQIEDASRIPAQAFRPQQ